MDDLEEENYNGSITFLIRDDGATIEIYDNISRECVVDVKLTPVQLCQALSRLSYTQCDIRYGELQNVGKKLKVDYIVFPIPEHDYKDRNEVAYREALKNCPDGWKVDNYFGSKGSFGWNKDGSKFARATIRRWE